MCNNQQILLYKVKNILQGKGRNSNKLFMPFIGKAFFDLKNLSSFVSSSL